MSDTLEPATFEGFQAMPPQGSSAERWEAGAAVEVEVRVGVTGEPLTDYPGVVLACDDASLEFVSARVHILYGMGRGDGYPLTWTLRAPKDAPVGKRYTLRVRLYTNNMDEGAGRAPLGEARFELELGQALSPRPE